MKVIIIGAGISGLSAAAHLGKMGYEVEVLERHAQAGGRARQWQIDGYKFDMGPSWYWMPDIFERFYNQFGYSTQELYTLKRLTPSYELVFAEAKVIRPAERKAIMNLFDHYDEGSGLRLKKFLDNAAYNYEQAIEKFVWKPGLSWKEFIEWDLIKASLKSGLFRPLSRYTTRVSDHPYLKKILEFPVLFLGATAENTPALYSLMNYADMEMGTWYPMGGMYKIIEAMEKICYENNVTIHYNKDVQSIETGDDEVKYVTTMDHSDYTCDILIGAADYNHVEQDLLSDELSIYNEKYWDNRKMSPSALLMFLGIKEKVEGLAHHTLFFDTDYEKHVKAIYEDVQWPENPLFYVCHPTETDHTISPDNTSILFALVPVASGLEENTIVKQKITNTVIERIENHIGSRIKDRIEVKRIYSVSDFQQDYNAFKGNAYGLANVLQQTGFLKPKMKHDKLNNMYFTGQLTSPGPGLPPSLISGEVIARLIENDFPIKD